MASRFDLHVRLEATHVAHDQAAVRRALRAEVHDPVWFLGRQWQLGEHRGSDTASPALTHITVGETPVEGASGLPDHDPANTPPEAIIESEPEQWWTTGRRVRVGRVLRNQVPAERRADQALLIGGLAPPYDNLNGRTLDGLALYRDRTALGLPDAVFTEHGVPEFEPADDWQPSELMYRASFNAGPVTLTIPRHDGGDVDWHSASAAGGDPPASNPPDVRTSYPTRVSHPGAPSLRWWQIEDHRRDPGAVAPHRTHLAAMMLAHVSATHGDDWFTAPLAATTGTLLAVTAMEVEDSMGLTSNSRPVTDWSMFRVSGRSASELLIWPTVTNPLTASTALDEVLLGIDEDANVLWAVERRAEGRELFEPDDPGEPPPVDAPGQIVVTGRATYRYVPTTVVRARWHPYLLHDTSEERRFVQGRLADLSLRPITARPGATSRLLVDPVATPSDPTHQIRPEAIPRSGVRLDRRYVLGRRTDGEPVLWIQRRRLPLAGPPTSGMRFDVLDAVPDVTA